MTYHGTVEINPWQSWESLPEFFGEKFESWLLVLLACITSLLALDKWTPDLVRIFRNFWIGFFGIWAVVMLVVNLNNIVVTL
jgi:hypothetical protein